MSDTMKLILVVDDDAAMRQFVSLLLKLEGFKAEAVDGGASALARLELEPRPDLVLLDIMMPDMDGFTVLKHIKANPTTADIAVGMISARVDAYAERVALAYGALGLVIKPIEVTDLLSIIGRAVEGAA